MQVKEFVNLVNKPLLPKASGAPSVFHEYFFFFWNYAPCFHAILKWLAYKSVVNIFSGPSSNDDYLGHSENRDWLTDWQKHIFQETTLPWVTCDWSWVIYQTNTDKSVKLVRTYVCTYVCIYMYVRMWQDH